MCLSACVHVKIQASGKERENHWNIVWLRWPRRHWEGQLTREYLTKYVEREREQYAKQEEKKRETENRGPKHKCPGIKKKYPLLLLFRHVQAERTVSLFKPLWQTHTHSCLNTFQRWGRRKRLWSVCTPAFLFFSCHRKKRLSFISARLFFPLPFLFPLPTVWDDSELANAGTK